MAIQVGGTTVISDNRALENITSVDSSLAESVANNILEEITVYGGTTSALSHTHAAGEYTLDWNQPTNWSIGALQNGFTSFYAGANYMGASIGFYAYIGTSYYRIYGSTYLSVNATTNLLANFQSQFNSLPTAKSFTTTSNFKIRVVLGTYPGPSSAAADMSTAFTNFGEAGGYKVPAGFTFGFRIKTPAYQNISTGSGTVSF